MYDYKEGKKRIQEIIANKLEIEKEQEIPRDDHFTYENAYYGLVGAIFVDIRNSTQLFAHENKEEMSKAIRCFSSEVIEIVSLDIEGSSVTPTVKLSILYNFISSF